MMEVIKTYHAPPERESLELITIQTKKVSDYLGPEAVLDSISHLFLVLNSKRQVVYANKNVDQFIQNGEEFLGQRVGELLDCQHSSEMEAGCGTSEACKTCGAINAILHSLDGKADLQDCQIIQSGAHNALDLRVSSNPIKIKDEDFVVVDITDVSHEKRRRALERIFFHDIINIAGGLKGYSQLLKDYPEDVEEFKDPIHFLSNQLIDELMGQKQLSAAENNELHLNIVTFTVEKFLNDLADAYSQISVAKDKFVKVSNTDIDPRLEIANDHTLLGRVLGNMIKNALEASQKEKTVTISFELDKDYITFSVHNESFIPREIQLQIFNRSFSTKAYDRGLGTYSMKLLSEKYLKGEICFESFEEKGTTFFAKYPRILKQENYGSMI